MNQLTDDAAGDETRARTRPALHTDRLELIPLDDVHLEVEVELDSDPQVLRYLAGRALTRSEVERAHRRRMAAGEKIPGLGFWVGFRGGEFVGWWTLQPPHGPDQPQVPGQADLGYRLLRRWWRQGLATEGARELLRYGFVDMRLDRIFAQTLTVNLPSRAVMASIGMTYVRTFASACPEPLVAGSELGEVEYAITRDQWAQTPRVSTSSRQRTPGGRSSSRAKPSLEPGHRRRAGGADSAVAGLPSCSALLTFRESRRLRIRQD